MANLDLTNADRRAAELRGPDCNGDTQLNGAALTAEPAASDCSVATSSPVPHDGDQSNGAAARAESTESPRTVPPGTSSAQPLTLEAAVKSLPDDAHPHAYSVLAHFNGGCESLYRLALLLGQSPSRAVRSYAVDVTELAARLETLGCKAIAEAADVR